ncbi:MAG: cytochrome C, partial [Gammaproteobacteria bacterium]
MKLRTLLVYGFAATSLACSTAVQARHSVDKKLLERGRYLVRIGGCNDCHTAGYAESGGKTPE